MTTDKRDGMFQHIHIQVSDTFGSVRAVWPNGTIHEHSLPKGVDAHRVAAVVADALSEHVYTGPGGRSAVQPAVGASGLQCITERLALFLDRNSFQLSHYRDGWIITSRLGETLGVFTNLSYLLDVLEEIYP